MTDRFDDRLDAATYEDDEVVGVFESDPGESDSLWLSERLFCRLTAVANGYELHTPPMLGGSDPVRLNQQRCQSLLDELAFVAERLEPTGCRDCSSDSGLRRRTRSSS